MFQANSAYRELSSRSSMSAMQNRAGADNKENPRRNKAAVRRHPADTLQGHRRHGGSSGWTFREPPQGGLLSVDWRPGDRRRIRVDRHPAVEVEQAYLLP